MFKRLKILETGRTHLDWPVIAFMTAVHVFALAAIPFISVNNVIACAVMYFVTGCLGITLTFHRMLTHRTFAVPKWLERILATCGVLALQGSPLKWVAHHRLHHAGSDTPKDPHNAREGFWYSHMGWLFGHHPYIDDEKTINRFGRDIAADPYYRWLHHVPNQLIVQAMCGVVLFLIGGWSMVGWGLFMRLVLVYHTTWFVNSAAHIWGYTNYTVSDSSKNNWWVALLTWGEGWHNNHHTLQGVAPAGHRWWEVDITYMIILTLKSVGLATNVKTLETEFKSVEQARAANVAAFAKIRA